MRDERHHDAGNAAILACIHYLPLSRCTYLDAGNIDAITTGSFPFRRTRRRGAEAGSRSGTHDDWRQADECPWNPHDNRINGASVGKGHDSLALLNVSATELCRGRNKRPEESSEIEIFSEPNLNICLSLLMARRGVLREVVQKRNI